MITKRQIILAIKEEFYEALEKKTGWGRNEIKKEYEEAISRAFMRFVEEEE